MDFTAEMQQNVVTVLVRLDNEAKEPNIGPEEFAKRGFGIQNLLRKVESDFGTGMMMKMFIKANEAAGHTIGPLDASFVKELMKMGCTITGVHKVVKYNK